MKIALEAKIRRNDDIVFGDCEGELALLDIDSGDHFGLNETGARIWELLDTTQSAAELIAALVREFDAPAEALRAEVLAFLERLIESGIVEIAAESD